MAKKPAKKYVNKDIKALVTTLRSHIKTLKAEKHQTPAVLQAIEKMEAQVAALEA